MVDCLLQSGSTKNATDQLMAVTDASVNGTQDIEQLEGTIELEHSPQGDKEPGTSLEENETTVEPDKLTIEPWKNYLKTFRERTIH